jgi:hypothetical protein
VDGIKGPTPCTLMFIEGRTSRTIKVAEATVMPSCIYHGRPVLVECAVVEVTMIREGCEFKDLDYPDEDEGIENWLMLKGLSFSGPAKILLSKPVRRLLFHHETQRLGALLFQTCRSLLKSLMRQRLLTLKMFMTQQKSLKSQSSRTTGSVGRLFLLKTQSSRTAWGEGRFL